MNLSKISNQGFLGKALRFPLRFIPKNTILPIIQGRLRGRFWIVGSSNHGCWLGSYEHEKQKLFSDAIRKNTIVFDIGAHVGFYTLLSSVLVGPRGMVIAFEPLPKNIEYLKKHCALNNLKNVDIIEAAVSDVAGRARFRMGSVSSATSHLADSGDTEVQTTTIDSLALVGKIPSPDYLKIDAEGAENKILKGARQTLIMHQPTIFLSTHSPDLRSECLGILVDHGYYVRPIGATDPHSADEFLATGKIN